MHVVQWAFENGCPWHDNTCVSAAKGGHLDILKWARSHGCPWDESVNEEAGIVFSLLRIFYF